MHPAPAAAAAGLDLLSSHTLAPPARAPLLDALRALALLSVLVVNAAGYLVAPWGALLGERSPPGSALASTVQALVAALLQGKGYPMLAFLFGMGLWLAQRRRAASLARQRGVARQKKLLRLGVLHGMLVYFGDILTMYALVGWNLLAHVREPWRSLRRRLRRALGWALGVTLVSVVLTAWIAAPGGWADPATLATDPTLAAAAHWRDFWWTNAGAYLTLQIGALLMLWPVLRLCMLCGVAAARLRLLTHRRWRQQLKRWTARAAAPLLLLNLGYGLAYIHVTTDSARALWLDWMGTLIGPPLAALYVVALAMAARGGVAAWCRALAPLGQRTLTLYVGHSLLCLALFSGVGLGWRPGTVGMAAFAVALWAAALVAARASGAWRWPLEAWLARR